MPVRPRIERTWGKGGGGGIFHRIFIFLTARVRALPRHSTKKKPLPNRRTSRVPCGGAGSVSAPRRQPTAPPSSLSDRTPSALHTNTSTRTHTRSHEYTRAHTQSNRLTGRLGCSAGAGSGARHRPCQRGHPSLPPLAAAAGACVRGPARACVREFVNERKRGSGGRGQEVARRSQASGQSRRGRNGIDVACSPQPKPSLNARLALTSHISRPPPVPCKRADILLARTVRAPTMRLARARPARTRTSADARVVASGRSISPHSHSRSKSMLPSPSQVLVDASAP